MDRKTISKEQLSGLKAVFAGYRQMRQRVDAMNRDLERFHTRITKVILQSLEEQKPLANAATTKHK